MGRLHRTEAVGRQAAKLAARGDLELPKDLVQVVLDRSWADEPVRVLRALAQSGLDSFEPLVDLAELLGRRSLGIRPLLLEA